MSDIIVEPDKEIKNSISYSKFEKRLIFNGSSEFNTTVNDKLFFIKITLVNVRGEKAEYNQAVYIVSKTVEDIQSSKINEVVEDQTEV